MLKKLIVTFCLLILFFVSNNCKKKNSNDVIENFDIERKNDVNYKLPKDKPNAQQLFKMALDTLKSNEMQLMRETMYDKAIELLNKIVEMYPSDRLVVKAYFYIAKTTEEKIKDLNLREIELRKKYAGKTLEFEKLKPFLTPYTEAINNYKKLYYKYIKNELPKNRETVDFVIESLLAASRLLSDEINPKMNYKEAIRLNKILFTEFRNSDYADLAIYNIITIYYNSKDWNNLLKTCELFLKEFNISSFSSDVRNKYKKAKFYINKN